MRDAQQRPYSDWQYPLRTIELHRWLHRSEVTGKVVKTSYVLTEADAKEQWPDATPVPGSIEFREIPDTPEEHAEVSRRNSTAKR